MATLTSYIRSISEDFLNGIINSSSLTKEISASSISIALSHIDTDGDTCSIWFKDVLIPAETTTLDYIIGNHTGDKTVKTPESVRINEESTDTGGRFEARTVTTIAPANSSGQSEVWWPYPVSALVVKFSTTATQTGDTVSMYVGKNTTTGVITSDISSLAPAWISQNYIAGQKVTYSDPNFGDLVYTCVIDTISNEVPGNNVYWKHGFEVAVSSTVISNTEVGYNISLDDGTNISDMGRVVEKTSSLLYLNNAPITTFSVSTPTIVKQTITSFENYSIGNPRTHVIGDSKIGGSYIPKFTKVTIVYTNNHNVDQSIIGSVELLS